MRSVNNMHVDLKFQESIVDSDAMSSNNLVTAYQ